MYYKDLTEFESVNDWFGDLCIIGDKKQNSKRNHLQALKKYVEFTVMNPDELIQKADEEQDNVKKYKNRSVKRYLTDFRNHLEQAGFSPNYVRLHIHSIQSFYKNHEINLNVVKGEKALPLEENNKQLTKETIADVLNKSSIKQRAIILSIVSSGLSSIDIRELTVKKYYEGYDPETEVCTLYLRRHKSKVDFVTFFNIECTRQINLYLDDRRKSKDPTQQIHNDEGYLFIVDQLSHPEVYLDSEYAKKQKEYIESKKKYDDAKMKGIEPLPEIKHPEYAIPREDHRKYSIQGFVKIFRDLSKRCGIHSAGEHNLFRAHNLRKFFKQTLQNKNINAEMIEMWMGHEIGAVGDAYSRYSPVQLETYMSVMHLLFINKQMDVSNEKAYIELEKKMKNLEIEAETNKVERYELQKQNERLVALESLNSQLNAYIDKLIEKGDETALKMLKNLQEARKPTAEEIYYPLLEVDEEGNTIND